MACTVEVLRDNMIEVGRLRAERGKAAKHAEAEKRAAMQRLADAFWAAIGTIVETVLSTSTELEAAAGTTDRGSGKHAAIVSNRRRRLRTSFGQHPVRCVGNR